MAQTAACLCLNVRLTASLPKTSNVDGNDEEEVSPTSAFDLSALAGSDLQLAPQGLSVEIPPLVSLSVTGNWASLTCRLCGASPVSLRLSDSTAAFSPTLGATPTFAHSILETADAAILGPDILVDDAQIALAKKDLGYSEAFKVRISPKLREKQESSVAQKTHEILRNRCSAHVSLLKLNAEARLEEFKAQLDAEVKAAMQKAKDEERILCSLIDQAALTKDLPVRDPSLAIMKTKEKNELASSSLPIQMRSVSNPPLFDFDEHVNQEVDPKTLPIIHDQGIVFSDSESSRFINDLQTK